MVNYAAVAFLSGMVGGVITLAAALGFEVLVERGHLASPNVSYGQAFAFGGLPLAVAVSVVVGCGTFRAITKKDTGLGWTWLATFSFVAMYVLNLWRIDWVQHDHDSSQIILYGPATFFSLLGVAVWLTSRRRA